MVCCTQPLSHQHAKSSAGTKEGQLHLSRDQGTGWKRLCRSWGPNLSPALPGQHQPTALSTTAPGVELHHCPGRPRAGLASSFGAEMFLPASTKAEGAGGISERGLQGPAGSEHTRPTLTQSISQSSAATIWGQVCGAPTVYMELLDRAKGYLQGGEDAELLQRAQPSRAPCKGH